MNNLEWCFKQFLISRIILIIVIFTSFSILPNLLKPSDVTQTFLVQYEKEYSNITADANSHISNKIDNNHDINNINNDYTVINNYISESGLLFLKETPELEKILLKFLHKFYTYDSQHFIHLSINNYTNKKNLAFFPSLPFLIRKSTYYFTSYIYTFHMRITAFLLMGFLINTFFTLLNVILLYKLFSKIVNIKTTYGENLIKRIVWLFLYNPGSAFFLSIYTENLFFFQHIMIITILINFSIDKLLSYNNILYIVTMSFFAIGTKSNGLLFCLYFFSPVIVLLWKGFIEYNKEQSKSNYYINTSSRDSLFANIKKVFYTINKNRLSAFKIITMIISCYLSFFFFTKIVPKNTICEMLISRIKDFRNIETTHYPESNFTTYNKTLLYNTKSLNYYDLTEDPLFDFCNHLNTTVQRDIYTEVQNDYWSTGFLLQWKIFPENLDRVILAIPINLLSLVYIYCTLKRYFRLSALFSLNVPKLLKIDESFSSEIEKKEIYKRINTQGTIDKYQESVIQIKSMMFCAVFYHIAAVALLFLFGHLQIGNRILSCSPFFYFFLAQCLNPNENSFTFDKEIIKEMKNYEKEEKSKLLNEDKASSSETNPFSEIHNHDNPSKTKQTNSDKNSHSHNHDNNNTCNHSINKKGLLNISYLMIIDMVKNGNILNELSSSELVKVLFKKFIYFVFTTFTIVGVIMHYGSYGFA